MYQQKILSLHRKRLTAPSSQFNLDSRGGRKADRPRTPADPTPWMMKDVNRSVFSRSNRRKDFTPRCPDGPHACAPPLPLQRLPGPGPNTDSDVFEDRIEVLGFAFFPATSGANSELKDAQCKTGENPGFALMHGREMMPSPPFRCFLKTHAWKPPERAV